MSLESQTWYCKNCPITNDDCGEYQQSSDIFYKVNAIHKNHEGWQKGKPDPKTQLSEIEKIFTEKAIKLANEGFFDKERLKQSVKDENSSLPLDENNTIDSVDNSSESITESEEETQNILEHIIQVCGKEIKEENTNIEQITLVFLSSYTKNPMNLRILAPSGEGKTYLVTQIAKLFPEENVVILAKATAQSWKYNFITKKLVENGAGNWQDYEIAIKPLQEQLAKSKIKEEQDEIQQQIRELQDSSCDLVDFTHKTIILVDSQSFELFENIKTTLSHDQDNIKSYSVNKSKSGTLQGQKFIIRGFPAVIYCSAKDEQMKDETNEINTRFNTISLNTSSKKYRKMLEFEATKSGLPDFIYQEDVVSKADFEELKEEIRQLTENIKKDNEIVNPYAMGISALMRSDAGYRTRQLKILNNNIRMHTLVNSKNRPRIIHDGKKFPIATRLDIEKSCALTKESLEIQIYKIKVFNEQIRPALLEINKQRTLVNVEQKGLTSSELVEVLIKINPTIDRQRLQETILKPLVDHGYLEKTRDESNKTRDIYYLPKRFIEKPASFESTLIDVSAIDTTCIDSYVNRYLEQRFDDGEITIEDEKGKSISIDELITLLHSIDVRHSQNMHESDNNDSSNKKGDD
jgi:hypothetical protein